MCVCEYEKEKEKKGGREEEEGEREEEKFLVIMRQTVCDLSESYRGFWFSLIGPLHFLVIDTD